ncbi:MAG: peroxiredoxin [Paracoccaceae bacterium]|nr:peroxiredoxin [Paracoccaceae bacterium]
MAQTFYEVDWSTLPEPEDDGAADHLPGLALPSIALASTGGDPVDLAALPGLTILYIYPKTGQPGTEMPDGWDMIPGARGCTPQSCAFRDHYADLRSLGVAQLFGLSTQSTAYQTEARDRMHLPFDLLSDESLAFAGALNLPTFGAGGERLIKRMSLAIEAGRIVDAIYPVFPPDANAAMVEDWLRGR